MSMRKQIQVEAEKRISRYHGAMAYKDNKTGVILKVERRNQISWTVDYPKGAEKVNKRVLETTMTFLGPWREYDCA